MVYLGIFWLVGIGGGLLLLFRLAGSVAALGKEAQKTKGFHLRRPSLSPAEWRNWNREFFTFRFLRIPLMLALAEVLVLALAFKQAHHLPGLLAFAFLWQLCPVLVAYLVHLSLLYRYGRFNLHRFDPTGRVGDDVALVVIYLSAWLPPGAVWLFLSLWGRS